MYMYYENDRLLVRASNNQQRSCYVVYVVSVHVKHQRYNVYNMNKIRIKSMIKPSLNRQLPASCTISKYR